MGNTIAVTRPLRTANKKPTLKFCGMELEHVRSHTCPVTGTLNSSYRRGDLVVGIDTGPVSESFVCVVLILGNNELDVASGRGKTLANAKVNAEREAFRVFRTLGRALDYEVTG